MRSGAVLLVLFTLFISQASALSFSIDSGCSSSEIALFSISNQTNAHAAEPDYYNLQVCATEVEGASIQDSCDSIANPVLSFYEKDTGTSHLSPRDQHFNYVLCSRNLATSVWKDCPGSTEPIVSIYDPVQNHVAEPDHYKWQICGGLFENATLAYEFTMSGNRTFIANFNRTDQAIERTDDPGYVAVQNDTVLSGIVGNDNTPQTVGIRNNSGRAELNSSMTGSTNFEWYVPFISGKYFELEDRIDLIETGTFLSYFNPNFAFELTKDVMIRIGLELSDVDIVNSVSLGPGFHTIGIENVGENDEGEPEVRINVTEP